MTKTADEIFAAMKESFEAAAGSLNGDADMALRLYAAAAEIESLYTYGDWVKKQCFPQTAEGEYLDRHAEMRGLARNSAVKAEGTIRFSIDEALASDLTVAAGTVCLTAAEVYFETTDDAVIPAGSLSCDAPARAQIAGKAGNVKANTVVYMNSAPVGISACANPAAFTGGDDAENDEDLRKRVLASYRTLPNGANKAYYEKTVLGIDGVRAVSVLPKNRGVGTVDVVVSSATGLPSQTLLDEVESVLNAVREICVDVKVAAPTAVTVDISAQIDAEAGYDAEAVRAAAGEALSAYFDGDLLGSDVTLAKLGNILYGVAGVKNYRISSPAADVAAEATELPVAGTITISAWS